MFKNYTIIPYSNEALDEAKTKGNWEIVENREYVENYRKMAARLFAHIPDATPENDPTYEYGKRLQKWQEKVRLEAEAQGMHCKLIVLDNSQ